MGKKRWRPPDGPSATDAIKNRKAVAMSWEERRDLVESSKKRKGIIDLAQWEAQNVDGDVTDQIQKNLELKAARKAVAKAKKKAEKRVKKEEKKKKKKEKKKDKKKKDKKKDKKKA